MAQRISSASGDRSSAVGLTAARSQQQPSLFKKAVAACKQCYLVYDFVAVNGHLGRAGRSRSAAGFDSEAMKVQLLLIAIGVFEERIFPVEGDRTDGALTCFVKSPYGCHQESASVLFSAGVHSGYLCALKRNSIERSLCRSRSQSFEILHAIDDSRSLVNSADVLAFEARASTSSGRIGCPPAMRRRRLSRRLRRSAMAARQCIRVFSRTIWQPKWPSKGGQNFKTINKILNEEVSLREGAEIKKISKAEAVLRGVVVGALKGDARTVAMLLRFAEQAGGFEERDETPGLSG